MARRRTSRRARRYAKAHDLDSAVRLQRAMFAAVDEVIRVLDAEHIDAHTQKDGLLHVATTASQQSRLVDALPALRRYGWGEADLRLISASELAERVNVAGAVAATYSPHCARVQPALLVRGLAEARRADGGDHLRGHRGHTGPTEPGQHRQGPGPGGLRGPGVGGVHGRAHGVQARLASDEQQA
ncbi:MAG: FAD-dependent oxidoreductase [Nocardioidaceae bacterium]